MAQQVALQGVDQTNSRNLYDPANDPNNATPTSQMQQAQTYDNPGSGYVSGQAAPTAIGSGTNYAIHPEAPTPPSMPRPLTWDGSAASAAWADYDQKKKAFDDMQAADRNAFHTYALDKSAFTDPNAAANKGMLDKRISGIDARTGPQLDQTQSNEDRGRQMALANSLADAAAGRGPSVAQEQLNRATDQGIRAQMAMAASQRGGNPMLAQRAAMQNEAAIQQDASSQSAIIRAQEQQAARAELGNALAGMRGQDLGAASQNLGASLTTQGQNDAASQALLNARLGIDASQFQANQNYQVQGATLSAEQEAARHSTNLAQDAQMANIAMTGVGAGASVVGAGITAGSSKAASDERLKKNVTHADEDAKDFMDDLAAYTYDYKEPEKYGAGSRLGIMAQDMERSRMGGAAVSNTPDGKMIDVRKSLGAALAGIANLNKRLSSIEDD